MAKLGQNVFWFSWLLTVGSYKKYTYAPELSGANFFSSHLSILQYFIKKLYYNNGSVNIRYHGKQMTSLKDLLLWLTCLDICRGRTVARKCKFDFVLQLGICLSIPLHMEIDTVLLLMSRACMSNVTDTSQIRKKSKIFFETWKLRSDQTTNWF